VQTPIRLAESVQFQVSLRLNTVLRQAWLVIVLHVSRVLGVGKLFLMDGLRHFVDVGVAGCFFLLNRLHNLIIATGLPRTLPPQERREYLLNSSGTYGPFAFSRALLDDMEGCRLQISGLEDLLMCLVNILPILDGLQAVFSAD